MSGSTTGESPSPPDMALIDVRVSLADFHMGGATCQPPAGRFIAGFDPVATDALGASSLGYNWRNIAHIALADGLLSYAES